LSTRQYDRLTDYGEFPEWLPDSRRLIFASEGKHFFIIDVDTREVRKVFTSTRDVVGPPRLTRDGRTAYFSRRITESDIWLLTIEDGR